MRLLRPILLGIPVAAVAAAMGYFLAGRANTLLFAGLLRYSTGVIAIVWAFTMLVYGKIFDLTDMPGLRAREHTNLEHEVRSWIHSFWIKGLFLLLMALAVNLPQFLADAHLNVTASVFAVATVALAWSIQSIVALFSDLEDIRRLRSRVKQLERADAERAAASALLAADLAKPWVPDPEFPNPTIAEQPKPPLDGDAHRD